MKNIISYGGGTQSTALILMALEGKYNLPRPDFAVYADTGGEPEFINQYVDYFINLVKEKYNFDIFKIQKDNGLLHKLLYEKPRKNKEAKAYTSSNPPYFTLNPDGTKGIMMRQCTADYKIHPITKFINSKLERGEKYNLWIGISFEERSRMKTSYIKRRINYYPLVDNFIRRIDSILFVKELGFKTPNRSSCFFCPFHSDNYWQYLKIKEPKEFEKAVNFEKTVQQRQNDFKKSEIYLHRSCQPLDQVTFIDESQLNLFPELIDECNGYCGI